MTWTGVIALLLIFVTYSTGLSCYSCEYILTLEGEVIDRFSSQGSCDGNDTSKYNTQQCSTAQKVCVTRHWTKLSHTDYGTILNTTVIVRGCSGDQHASGCSNHTTGNYPNVNSTTDCYCNNRDYCNGQTRIVPAIFTHIIVIGFLLFMQ